MSPFHQELSSELVGPLLLWTASLIYGFGTEPKGEEATAGAVEGRRQVDGEGWRFCGSVCGKEVFFFSFLPLFLT